MWAKRFSFLLFVTLGCSICLTAAASAKNDRFKPIFKRAIKFGISQPLRSIKPVLPKQPPGTKPQIIEVPIRRRPMPPVQIPLRAQEDSVVQSSMPSPKMPTPSFSFDGISNNDNAVIILSLFIPPDTNGDVGPNHYVQIVNVLFEVFDKTSGASLLGPETLSTVFTGFGGPCETKDDGDPIVLYDSLADRWLLSQFVDAEPSHECIAISQTPDPTGAYFLYDFQHPLSKFGDYPKIGVWPDGYYMTVNQFSGSSFVGVGAFAFDRSAMLSGNPSAGFIYFDLVSDSSLFGILPADVDGIAPATGTPNYVAAASRIEFGNSVDGLRLFDFHADYVTPSNSTFVERSESPIAAASFNPVICNFFADCIPQPGTAVGLDPLGSNLMHRLQYRNFGVHESLVLNHTVDVSGANHAGVRYYELRRALPGGSFSINEQASFAPDADHRWMGSAAMDKDGNLAVGYSVSSSTTFPSIRYAGRLSSDPPGGLFQGEATLQAGAGSQTDPINPSNRWGDYSALTVDPSDGCTFWYTNEYYSSTSAFDWLTRIGRFKFASCVCTTITLSPGTLPNAALGTPYNQTITANCGAAPITFTVSSGALPTGLSLSSGGVLSGTPTANGTFNFTVTGTDATLATGSQAYSITVTSCLFCDDFEDGVLSSGWTYVKPLWLESAGNLTGLPTGRKAVAIASPIFAGCTTCTVEATMTTAGGIFNKLWLLGWYIDKNNTVEVLMKEENDKWVLRQRVGGAVAIKTKGIAPIVPGIFYDVQVSFSGGVFTLRVDGSILATMPAAVTPFGTVGFQVKNTIGDFGLIQVN